MIWFFGSMPHAMANSDQNAFKSMLSGRMPIEADSGKHDNP
jgi:hypothetical protein